jgi:thioredoxin-like negative regulator of GroEL
MNRNTILALVALAAILAGTVFWRYTTFSEDMRRQREISSALERTEGDHHARLAVLDSICTEYPDDKVIQKVAKYQILHTHDEMSSPHQYITRAAEEFIAADSGAAAMNYVASVFSSNRIPGDAGLRYARSALAAAQRMDRPENLTHGQWAEQRRIMIGETLHILGALQLVNADLTSARTTLEAAADSVPDSPNFLRTIAALYEEIGNRRDALERYKDVVRLRYDDRTARDNIRRLYPEMFGYMTPVSFVLDTLVQNARTARREAILADTLSRPMPLFQLAGPRQEVFNSDQFAGKILILNTWATWCVPCEKLLPLMQDAYEYHGRTPDVAFLTVSFDQEKENVLPFIERHRFTFPVAFGDRALYDALGMSGIPTTIVADTSGTIRFQHLGFTDVGDFVEEIGWQIDAAREAMR